MTQLLVENRRQNLVESLFPSENLVTKSWLLSLRQTQELECMSILQSKTIKKPSYSQLNQKHVNQFEKLTNLVEIIENLESDNSSFSEKFSRIKRDLPLFLSSEEVPQEMINNVNYFLIRSEKENLRKKSKNLNKYFLNLIEILKNLLKQLLKNLIEEKQLLFFKDINLFDNIENESKSKYICYNKKKITKKKEETNDLKKQEKHLQDKEPNRKEKQKQNKGEDGEEKQKEKKDNIKNREQGQEDKKKHIEKNYEKEKYTKGLKKEEEKLFQLTSLTLLSNLIHHHLLELGVIEGFLNVLTSFSNHPCLAHLLRCLATLASSQEAVMIFINNSGFKRCSILIKNNSILSPHISYELIGLLSNVTTPTFTLNQSMASLLPYSVEFIEFSIDEIKKCSQWPQMLLILSFLNNLIIINPLSFFSRHHDNLMDFLLFDVQAKNLDNDLYVKIQIINLITSLLNQSEASYLSITHQQALSFILVNNLDLDPEMTQFQSHVMFDLIDKSVKLITSLSSVLAIYLLEKNCIRSLLNICKVVDLSTNQGDRIFSSCLNALKEFHNIQELNKN